MDIKITEKKEAPLLYRTEITADVTSEKATPSREELKKGCASALKIDEKLIVVKKIITSFGSKKSKAVIFQYKDEKRLKSIEPKEKKKEAKPGEEKEDAAEAKPEEKKEETKEAKPDKKKEKPKK